MSKFHNLKKLWWILLSSETGTDVKSCVSNLIVVLKKNTRRNSYDHLRHAHINTNICKLVRRKEDSKNTFSSHQITKPWHSGWWKMHISTKKQFVLVHTPPVNEHIICVMSSGMQISSLYSLLKKRKKTKRGRKEPLKFMASKIAIQMSACQKFDDIHHWKLNYHFSKYIFGNIVLVFDLRTLSISPFCLSLLVFASLLFIGFSFTSLILSVTFIENSWIIFFDAMLIKSFWFPCLFRTFRYTYHSLATCHHQPEIQQVEI